jgi:hypothetical protein
MYSFAKSNAHGKMEFFPTETFKVEYANEYCGRFDEHVLVWVHEEEHLGCHGGAR